ncbi:MAG: two-component regulator propeller domain-containing protein [Balneolaceae bacterium]|nr:two-component regulator propeller domain-containing protein [Balneolaceae bacterium]
MKRFFLIAFFMGIAFQAYAQLLPFRSYSIEKGLSQAVVNDLMQDDDGYLWVATGYGLNRFDGFTFKNYYGENGLNNNKTFSLLQDSKERVWIGTGNGVNIIQGDSVHSVPELNALNSSTILSIFEDSQGEFWFATDGQGVWHYDTSEKLTQYQEIHGLAGNRVRDIVEDQQGTLWFGTREGLTNLKDGNFRSYSTKDGLPDNKIRDLTLDEQNNIWIGTRSGLSIWKNGTFQNFTEEEGLVNNRIQSISIDGEGGLWIGTEEGVSHYNNGIFENYSTEQGLSNDIIYATLLDREGNIWFGTFGGGINLFFGDYIKNFTIEEGLPNNVITSITQDQFSNHWITTYGGGIARYDGSEFTTFNQRDGLVDNKVYSAIVDKNNRILIGTRWGLSIYADKQFYNFDEDELPYRKIRDIAEHKDENEFWLGTYGEGILKFRNNKFKLFDEQDGLANNTVLSVEQGADGSFWFATYGGVSRFKNGEFTNYTIQDGLPNNGVLDILKARNGDIWVSTFGGIARFNGTSFESVTPSDGLPDEVCYFILQDNTGLFWIGTKEGVVRFDYDTYQSENNKEDNARSFQLYTQDQGIIANEMNAGAGFKDRDGKLWFGSVGGLTWFDPQGVKKNNAAPKIHIEQVSISGEDKKPEKGFKVPSDNYNLAFHFVGISFSAPEQVVYEYRLKGTGEDWQRTKQRSVRYSALLPGEYTFEVRAQNNDGVWSEERADITFNVLAPIWLKWWFILLVALVFIGIMIFIYNYYRVKKMVEIERMRVRIASDLHDDVGSSLTEIALQSDFLQATEVDDELKQTLDQIGTQSRKIVSSLDDIVWSIDARNDTLGDLTDRMQDYINNMLSQKEVVYEFDDLDMDDKLTVPMKENLYLIFKEAINNIAKHSDATKVEVALKNEGDSFELLIHDNGSGVNSVRKSGHGLRNMKMRAQRIDADITFENSDGFTVHVIGNGM